jgi:hypothetical protein
VYVGIFMSKKQNNRIGTNSNFNISRRLKSEGRISEEFEVMLNNLSLEEMISLKLELASRIMRRSEENKYEIVNYQLSPSMPLTKVVMC